MVMEVRGAMLPTGPLKVTAPPHGARIRSRVAPTVSESRGAVEGDVSAAADAVGDGDGGGADEDGYVVDDASTWLTLEVMVMGVFEFTWMVLA